MPKVSEREQRIRRYVTDYSARTLAEMLMSLEDELELHGERAQAEALRAMAESGRRLRKQLAKGAR